MSCRRWVDVECHAFYLICRNGPAAPKKRQVSKNLASLSYHPSNEQLPTEESDAQLVAAIGEGAVDRLRVLSNDYGVSEVLEACGKQFVSAIRRAVGADGRVEALWYLREQSISHDYHRYGNLGNRTDTER